MSKIIYEMVTERIMEMLKQGVVPWRRPWVNHLAVNWQKQRPYRGINTFLLPPGEYATFKQVSQAGGKVKKGEKGHIVVFWKQVEIEDKEGEKEKVPFLRYHKVFEINTQCEGMESRREEDKVFEHDPIEEAERIVTGFTNSPPIKFASGRAYYVPAQDYISVPPMQDYPKLEEYYSTLFHEMMHSTGHHTRLNRAGIETVAKFGDEVYSKEELIAEIGAAMLCAECRIDNATIENSASYIAGWLKKLKDDPKLVIQAAGQAQKGVDHILGRTYMTNKSEGEETTAA